MTSSWLEAGFDGGLDAAENNRMMEYLQFPGNESLHPADNFDISDGGSIKSEYSEAPSPADSDVQPSWIDSPALPIKQWERSNAYTESYRKSQLRIQDLSFGRVKSKDDCDVPPPPDHNDYAQALGSPQSYKYHILLDPLPTRSRVETQIKCRLLFTSPTIEHMLHLPTDTIARPRFQLREPFTPSPDVLDLEVDAIVPSEPNKPVYMCSKCIFREKKRAFRKKTLDVNEEHHWDEKAPRRLIIFNCKELVLIPLPKLCEFPNGESLMCRQVDLPLRLACYCRHHSAKDGYTLVFTLRDYKGDIVGRTISNPIFITDNHKEIRSSDSVPPSSSYTASDASAQAYGMSDSTHGSMHSVDSSSDHARQTLYHPYRRNNSVPITPSAQGDTTARHAQSQSQIGPPQRQALMSFGNLSLPGPNAKPQSVPTIQKVIPSQGTVRGGVEITLLGQGFQPGMVSMFGDTAAISTQCWSDNTLISHLPPAVQPGTVEVTLKDIPPFPGNPIATFTYVNDTESKLEELALQVVGYKMTGKIENANDIASRILQKDHNGGGFGFTDSNNGGFGGGFSYQEHESSSDPELLVLKCLEFVRKPGGRIPNLNLRNTEGQTLMHLACILGYMDVITVLTAQGAHLDMQDVSGMTPLHFAAMGGNKAVTRFLLSGHADPFHRNYSGQMVSDVADPSVADLLPRNQREYYQKLNTSNSSTAIASSVDTNTLDHQAVESASVSDPNLSDDEEDSDNASDIEVIEAVKRLRLSQTRINPQYRKFIRFLSGILGIQRTPHSRGTPSTRPPSYADLFPDQSSKQRHKYSPKATIDLVISESEDEAEDVHVANQTNHDISVLTWPANPLKEIRNDQLLFTFWIPLLVICVSYILSLFVNIKDSFGLEKLQQAAGRACNIIANSTPLQQAAEVVRNGVL